MWTGCGATRQTPSNCGWLLSAPGRAKRTSSAGRQRAVEPAQRSGDWHTASETFAAAAASLRRKSSFWRSCQGRPSARRTCSSSQGCRSALRVSAKRTWSGRRSAAAARHTEPKRPVRRRRRRISATLATGSFRAPTSRTYPRACACCMAAPRRWKRAGPVSSTVPWRWTTTCSLTTSGTATTAKEGGSAQTGRHRWASPRATFRRTT